jgi:hypothetical protein
MPLKIVRRQSMKSCANEHGAIGTAQGRNTRATQRCCSRLPTNVRALAHVDVGRAAALARVSAQHRYVSMQTLSSWLSLRL